MNEPDEYVAPTVERLGTVADLTEASHLMNSDSGAMANTAFSNP
jgi:hypothetical protein